MPSWLEGKPFLLTFAVLLGIVFLRAQATYWIGRGVTAGLLHTRLQAWIQRPKTADAIDRVNRYGPPVVTLSFLTVGLQTVINAAAGLTRMPWVRYTVAMIVGCLAWAAIYATIGLAALEAAIALAARSPWALAAVIVLAVAVVVGFLVWRRRRTAAPDEARLPEA